MSIRDKVLVKGKEPVKCEIEGEEIYIREAGFNDLAKMGVGEENFLNAIIIKSVFDAEGNQIFADDEVDSLKLNVTTGAELFGLVAKYGGIPGEDDLKNLQRALTDGDTDSPTS